MKEYSVRLYDDADILELEALDRNEVIEVLEHIRRGYLPDARVYPKKDGDGWLKHLEHYTEEQYEATKMSIAIDKAIALLRKENEQ